MTPACAGQARQELALDCASMLSKDMRSPRPCLLRVARIHAFLTAIFALELNHYKTHHMRFILCDAAGPFVYSRALSVRETQPNKSARLAKCCAEVRERALCGLWSSCHKQCSECAESRVPWLTALHVAALPTCSDYVERRKLDLFFTETLVIHAVTSAFAVADARSMHCAPWKRLSLRGESAASRRYVTGLRFCTQLNEGTYR